MSTNLALVDPAVVPSRAPRPTRQNRPELVEVTPTKAQRRARPRIAYAVVAVAALGILLLAQLGISMVLSQGAYTLNSLSAEQTNLSRTQQSLSEELRVLDSPQNLARNAQALGMIANSTPVYLDPKTGRVYGTPTPAVADQATAATSNQVPNSLLDEVPLAAKQGDTSTSKESGPTAGSDAAAADAGKTAGASASAGASSTADVESDPNQLQAPSTR
ncbi:MULTISPECIES: hypothetical protein [unclassified Curtobacterium]|jgi:hypothetical protein|uniref:hypothetical protein n=1 Tax=unclassified Curtobacterium TaxID=257496 RepID=UPI00089DFD71|nr:MULTISPECIES: hypothetical protein [unclassified Curtobacterium]AOX66952.1 hypothetical protein BJK06_15545 [Curtobacterium sp. BH-2-1-1]MCT9622989.1 hypothetical protein [Curtobacterium sp. C2H10]OII24513.1 hypothetical protein BIV03_09345 [Curtobacterium sp. MCBA15_016]SFF89394.1 hypothetical protein SAMN05216329_3140 [Curtobacterium sp. YR515]